MLGLETKTKSPWGNEKLNLTLAAGFLGIMAYFAFRGSGGLGILAGNPLISPDPNNYLDQLKTAIIIEKEHKETIQKIINDALHDNLKSFQYYYGLIGEDHLKEFKDYYTRLVNMETKALKELRREI